MSKQRAVQEQWAASGILRQHQLFRGAERKRRTQKDEGNNNSTSQCHGSRGVEGLRKKGMVLEPNTVANPGRWKRLQNWLAWALFVCLLVF